MIDPIQSNANPIFAHVILEGAREILGEEQLNQTLDEVLSKEGCCAEGDSLTWLGARNLIAYTEKSYGALGSQGLALRIGRAAFKYGLEAYGDEMGFRTTEFRLLPAPRRLKTGLKEMAQLIAETYRQTVEVVDTDAFWEWRMLDGPDSLARTETNTFCYLISGVIQEFLTWAGGGRYYRVTETECRMAGGAACVFRIEKKPLD